MSNSKENNFSVYESLKQQYLDLYKQSELIQKENIHIYYDYSFTFGETHYRRYQLYYLCERFAKKIDIFTEKVLEESEINIPEIESSLDITFKDLKAKADLIKKEYEQALVFKSLPLMPEEDFKEMVEIFNYIIEYIHPDIAKNDKTTQKLWKKSSGAYRNSDLKLLRKCKEELIELDLDLPKKKEKNQDYSKEIIKFKNKIEILTSKNTYLINSFPYNKKELLKNKDMIAERLKEVEKDINLLEEMVVKLEFTLDEFVTSNKKYIC